MLYAVLKSLFSLHEFKKEKHELMTLIDCFIHLQDTGQRYKLSTLNIELPILK